MFPEIKIEAPVVQMGSIEFRDYERIKNEAIQLAKQMEEVEVTKENVKESKKLLAAVNKEVGKLETERKRIKKHLLEPYESFESQVKEIISLVKSTDEIMRQQVRQLEEEEREAKRLEIKAIFEKHAKRYDLKNLFQFEDFLQPKHLNKTTSLIKVEEDMVEWLTKIETDLEVIESLTNASEVLTEYQNLQNLSQSIQLIQRRKKAIEQVKNTTLLFTHNKKQYAFILFDEKDVKLTEMFMESNHIKFKKVEK